MKVADLDPSIRKMGVVQGEHRAAQRRARSGSPCCEERSEAELRNSAAQRSGAALAFTVMRRALVLAAMLLSTAATAGEFVNPEPYFPSGDGRRGVELMALERWAEARDALAAFAASKDGPTDEAGRARLELLVAYCDRRLGRHAAAAAGFDAAAGKLPLLADYARYEAAVSYFHLGDYPRARERAAAVDPDAVLRAEARLLAGDTLRAEERWGEAVAHYRDYLADHPNGIRVAEARFHLATAEEKVGGPAREVIPHYKRITVEHPLSSWSDRARARLGDLVATLPKKDRAAATALSAAELATRGKVYFDAMRNPLSEADFAAVLATKGLDAELRCSAAYHRAQSVFKQRQRPRAAPLFDEAVAACARTKNTDLKVRAAYQGGRAWSSAGQHPRAIDLFEQAESFAGHSFADDARLRQAEQWGYLEEKGVTEAGDKLAALLATLPERYPDGDMKGEALWRLAWRAWLAKDYAGAVTWLDRQNSAVPREENYYAEGQAHYWKGRALDQLGKPDEARAAYRLAVVEYPLSYYSLLALNRLRERNADADVLKEIRTPPPGWQKGQPAFRFAPRDLYDAPGYLRAVELLRLGLGAEAERELGRIGMRVPDGRKKVTDPDAAERLWATALLYDRARRYDKSHWIARWSVLDYKDAWPTEANRARWDIAYPRAYWHLLEPAAAARGYPPELLIAFVREESAFNPILESFANAIGLTQMILPTANRFGKDLGFGISRETLRDPEKNVAVGSRWLAFLWEKFHQHPGLIVAAYNAGEGAAWRWLCERGSWAYDEFGEAIPFDETRNYTKRVLSSYHAYGYLKDGSIPALSNVIPAEAFNAKRCGGARRPETAEKPDVAD
jgi:soluble lytic murein transglycosylase